MFTITKIPDEIREPSYTSLWINCPFHTGEFLLTIKIRQIKNKNLKETNNNWYACRLSQMQFSCAKTEPTVWASEKLVNSLKKVWSIRGVSGRFNKSLLSKSQSEPQSGFQSVYLTIVTRAPSTSHNKCDSSQTWVQVMSYTALQTDYFIHDTFLVTVTALDPPRRVALVTWHRSGL